MFQQYQKTNNRNENDKNFIIRNLPKVQALARIRSVEFPADLPGGMLRGVWRMGDFGLNVQDAVNIAAERERLLKEAVKLQEQMAQIERKLNNQDFISRAPDEIISENKTRFAELGDRYQKIQKNLKYLPVQ